MTAAQKKAKDNFKKAIAYRKATGVNLKDAFAYVYGRKVGAIKKKAAPKKKAAVKKAAPKKKTALKKKAAVKKVAPVKAAPTKTTIKKYNSVTTVSGIKKAAAKKVTGSHKDNKSHNVNIRVVSGVDSIRNETIKDIEETKKIILDQSALLERLQEAYKKSKSKINKEMIMMDIKTLKLNFIPHNKRYLKDLQNTLKKSI
jgi:hypothetical protein